jgi:phospholipase/lecithinase/hemolysin
MSRILTVAQRLPPERRRRASQTPIVSCKSARVGFPARALRAYFIHAKGDGVVREIGSRGSVRHSGEGIMLRALSRAATLTALVGGLHFATASHALVVQQMFWFGDSLSDSGNAASMTGGLYPSSAFFPPSQPSPIAGVGVPYNYRFSNGAVAAEHLAGLLGLPPSAPAWPSSPPNGNPNFAVGGAMTGRGPVGMPALPAEVQGLCCNFNALTNSPDGLPTLFPAVLRTGINTQVTLFSQRLAAGVVDFDPATTLFSIWGGPNDVFLALALIEANPGLSPAQQELLLGSYALNAALNIGTRVAELAALDAQHFLVLNMPDLGKTPFAAAQGLEDELTFISGLFNTALAGTLDALRGQGLDILEFDTFKALNDLIASGAFGNSSTPCLDPSNPDTINTILAGCPEYLFFDGVHPTTAAHAILAQQLAAAIPEPGVLGLLAAALLALAWSRRQALA